ncbi:helix-turn-helix domain-containing protein [Nonomuraea sp. NPDC049646]|uniref:helix-turn-helix domain-containing protein n=1 Tax=unclassified Nonomuraea TaxID=2593643 RepID=UPI0037A8DC24
MEPLAALADRVQSRRLELGLSIDRAAEAAGMSATTWSRVEQAKTVQKLTYAGVERVLGWAPGGCRLLLSGQEPTTTPATDAHATTPSPARYPDDAIAQHLWDTPDPALTDEDREALIQVYRALKRTRRPASTPARQLPAANRYT